MYVIKYEAVTYVSCTYFGYLSKLVRSEFQVNTGQALILKRICCLANEIFGYNHMFFLNLTDFC